MHLIKRSPEASGHFCSARGNDCDFYSFTWLVHKTKSYVICGPDPSPNKSNGKSPADSVVLDRPCSSQRINFKGPSLIHSLCLLLQVILLKIMGTLLRVKDAGLRKKEEKQRNRLRNIWGSLSGTTQACFQKHYLISMHWIRIPIENTWIKKGKMSGNVIRGSQRKRKPLFF